MSKWAEIINNLTDGIETAIFGYESMDADAPPITIAVVINETKEVEYKDDAAKTDEYAQKMIKEVIDRLQENLL